MESKSKLNDPKNAIKRIYKYGSVMYMSSQSVETASINGLQHWGGGGEGGGG